MKNNSVNKTHKIDIIYGIGLDSTNRQRVLRFVRLRLDKYSKKRVNSEGFLVVTPNPEIVLLAEKNDRLKSIINSADLSIPDGIGLAQAVRFLNLKTINIPLIKIVVIFFQGLYVGVTTWTKKDWLEKEIKIIPGREVFIDLMKLANKKGWKVVLLGDREDSAKYAVEALVKSYKRVKLTAVVGPNIDDIGKPKTKKDVSIQKHAVDTINNMGPHLLFVAFGAPKQEIWSGEWLGRLNVGGIMVVGGTFDYISGKVSLPPDWMQAATLEWLYRLFTQPHRFKRIFIAFPIFPLKMFWYKVKKVK